ncbi:DUF6705 family protein [Chryseobacterium sp. Hurlbut01]|jgi:hypothetical protein|uniref:DUF6705 family protein n=1 Tax=Chryseobacterium sp. Hurlbut01 TaxID=1681828 RepID=UPI00067D6F54|nr:DUF6705 family protein [Chryseobacterium sp. Hurlbut01]
MKTIAFLLLIIATSCKSQIYPLNTGISDLPPNAYIKDLNNELDKYVGLWKGNWNGKTLYLELKKVKYHDDDPNYPYYKDVILGERKVVSSNGTIEIDRISNFDYESPEIRGILYDVHGDEIFLFAAKNMCLKLASLYIKNLSNTQMTLHFEYMPSRYDPNCVHNAYVDQHDDFPINFPKDIVLTKQ